ncbi:MAG TPA: hypothetical protein VL574_14285 [Stellaceae bacterium]|jgi:hypothetical protein|nr:hypothetical protein [Stellaceae bacterium]
MVSRKQFATKKEIERALLAEIAKSLNFHLQSAHIEINCDDDFCNWNVTTFIPVLHPILQQKVMKIVEEMRRKMELVA